MPNSPSSTRITVFPTSHNGGISPAAHEVSVAITTVPIINRTAHISTHQSNNNVIITELADDSIDEVDCDRFVSRQNSTASVGRSYRSTPIRPADTSASAPSTLTKSKPEQKTGEVYV